MNYSYQTQGTCSTKIDFEMDSGVVKNVNFSGGCSGNLQAIAKLVEGMDAEEVIKRCSGICCGPKATSCGDQLANAISLALKDAEHRKCQ